MHIQQPITQNRVLPFINLHCGVILNDGTHHYGIVTGCKRGKLILKGHLREEDAGVESIKKRGKKKNLRAKMKTVPKGEHEAIRLDSVAVLFALFP